MEIPLLTSANCPLNDTLKKKLFPPIYSRNGILGGHLIPKGKREDDIDRHSARYSDSGYLIHNRLVHEKKLQGHFLDDSTLSSLLLHYARNGSLSEAVAIWDELLNSSFMLDAELVSQMICIYGGLNNFDFVSKILRQVQLKDPKLLPAIYASTITAFGEKGQLDCMEIMLKEMVLMGYPVDSTIGNDYVIYYSTFGSLSDSEVAYNRLKRSRILIEEEAVRALALSYIKENKYYALGCFVRDVGLGRRNMGNLLWNLLLLSYAARFKMKTLQREFVRMVESGFKPDLNTFNIRSLAFSRMSLIWDLHLSLDHMKHEGISPDLVTYGCVVDAYIERKLGKNLRFALDKLDVNDPVSILTDPIVFEAMGKGDFHLSSEVMMEYVKDKEDSTTYKKLISRYLKKVFRSNQIFWNH